MADGTNNTANELVSGLQAELAKERLAREQAEQYQQALIEEFSKADTYEDQLKVAKDAVAELLPSAIMTMKEVLANGDSEATRAGVAKYVMETVISGKLDKAGNDDIAKLLNELGATKPKPETTNEQKLVSNNGVIFKPTEG